MINKYGVRNNSDDVQPELIQNVIELGSGVIVIPRGMYFSGRLFF